MINKPILFAKAVGYVLIGMAMWIAAPILAALAVPAILIAGIYQALLYQHKQTKKKKKIT